jgi:GTP-binding protein Era
MVCGYVAIIGRPNVGKSTLLNRLIGQKLSITSRKAQTTRQRISGIKTLENAQIIYVDTPGIHKDTPRALNRYMNRVASSIIFDVDVIVFMVDCLHWTEDDEFVLKKLQKTEVPIILVINKVDKIKDKTELLPGLENLSQKMSFAEVIPLSASKGTNVDVLEKAILRFLPENPLIFPADQLSDRSEKFLAAEVIREKLLRHLGQEIPHRVTVEIEKFKWERKCLHIAAVIYVEKDSQKKIVIGEKGDRMKTIGTQARMDLEKMFAGKVFLQLWVKVKQGWSDDDRALKSLGFD